MLFDVLKDFATISLEELNATMSLMERVEKKYLITLNDFGELMDELRDDYYILSINNNSIFSYDNIYMDTADHMFFQQHAKSEKPRIKLRTREYVDSNLAFFEYKEKNGRVIRKSRYDIDPAESKDISKENIAFFRGICSSLELGYCDIDLTPNLRTNYKRITLCSKTSDERITIDFDIKVQDVRNPDTETMSFGSVVIVETKSSRKKTIWRKTIGKLWYRKAHGCSKYCLGLILTEKIAKEDKFENSLHFIKKANKKKHKIHKKTSQQLRMIKWGVIDEIKEVPLRYQHKKQV